MGPPRFVRPSVRVRKRMGTKIIVKGPLRTGCKLRDARLMPTRAMDASFADARAREREWGTRSERAVDAVARSERS